MTAPAAPAQNPTTTELAQTRTQTISESFVLKVERQFKAELGSPTAWTQLQKTLAQHLYLKIDASLAAAEIKRGRNSTAPAFTWANVNMVKLALDAVHRVHLGLDALLANHIHVIPYLNSRTQKYDLDLRIGYKGKDHVHRRFAIDPPLDVLYQLVHETDNFSYGRGADGVAWIKYEQTNPFNPGEVIGGFGYIIYEDPRKNRVVIVEYREFEKARKASKGTEFWGGMQQVWENGRKVDGQVDEKFEKEMQFKTVVHRVTEKIALDSSKVNQSILDAMAESEMDAVESQMEAEVAENGNGQMLAIDPAADPIIDADFSQEGEETPPPVEEEAAGY